MPRRRWKFTENGKPLPKPVEVVLDEAPATPAELPAHIPQPSGPIVTDATPAHAPTTTIGDWVDFKIPGQE